MHAIASVDTNRHIEKPYYFSAEKIPRDSYFCDNDYLPNTKSVTSRDNHSIIREALQSTLRLVNRTFEDRPTSLLGKIRITIRNFSAILRRKLLLSILLSPVYFVMRHDDVAPLSFPTNRRFQNGEGNVAQ
jgi:hypothetical protein